jgi:hypothetical protein
VTTAVDTSKENSEFGILDQEPPEAKNDGICLEPATGVERSIRTLRLLADIDWMAFPSALPRPSGRGVAFAWAIIEGPWRPASLRVCRRGRHDGDHLDSAKTVTTRSHDQATNPVHPRMNSTNFALSPRTRSSATVSGGRRGAQLGSTSLNGQSGFAMAARPRAMADAPKPHSHHESRGDGGADGLHRFSYESRASREWAAPPVRARIHGAQELTEEISVRSV